MKLINTSLIPPGGYKYREVAINWEVANPLMPIDLVIKEIQAVRMNNLHVGLDPSREAVEDALGLQVCARLNDKDRARFCGEVVFQPDFQPSGQGSNARRRRSCAGCG